MGIVSTLGADGLSAPIMWMPFGKRWLTLAVEGESKQSCVIFAVYFMSLHIAIGGDSKSIVITNCMQKNILVSHISKVARVLFELYNLFIKNIPSAVNIRRLWLLWG